MPDVPFLFIVVASSLVDAAVAGLALFFRRKDGPTSLGLGRVVVAVLVTGTVFLVKMRLLKRLGVELFGWVHLIYIDLVILVPAIGVALLATRWIILDGQPWRRPTTAVRFAAMASLLLVPIGVYATWIEPFRLRLEKTRFAVPDRREGTGTVRIGVLTDLQTDGVTDHERRAVDLLMVQRPDVILLPGDVFQGTHEQFEANRSALQELLGRLSAPGGVYLVLGDTEGSDDHLRFRRQRLQEILESTHIRLLDNEVARVTVNGRRLAIGGVELKYDSGPAREVVDRLEADADQGDVRILLAHRPDVALGLRPGSRIDLVVAGHTHGGQIVVPWYGPPVTLSDVPRAVAAGGLHRIGGNAIYVSRGVGCERNQAPRVRFLCPPEISLIEIGRGGPEEVGTEAAGSSPGT